MPFRKRRAHRVRLSLWTLSNRQLLFVFEFVFAALRHRRFDQFILFVERILSDKIQSLFPFHYFVLHHWFRKVSHSKCSCRLVCPFLLDGIQKKFSLFGNALRRQRPNRPLAFDLGLDFPISLDAL